jgi:hypothetical protein
MLVSRHNIPTFSRPPYRHTRRQSPANFLHTTLSSSCSSFSPLLLKDLLVIVRFALLIVPIYKKQLFLSSNEPAPLRLSGVRERRISANLLRLPCRCVLRSVLPDPRLGESRASLRSSPNLGLHATCNAGRRDILALLLPLLLAIFHHDPTSRARDEFALLAKRGARRLSPPDPPLRSSIKHQWRLHVDAEFATCNAGHGSVHSARRRKHTCIMRSPPAWPTISRSSRH